MNYGFVIWAKSKVLTPIFNPMCPRCRRTLNAKLSERSGYFWTCSFGCRYDSRRVA